MKLLWSSDLKIHTVHNSDVVLAATLAADWIRTVGGRAKADTAAAVDLPPSGVKKDQLVDLKGACACDKTVKAVVFNIVSRGLYSSRRSVRADSSILRVPSRSMMRPRRRTRSLWPSRSTLGSSMTTTAQ